MRYFLIEDFGAMVECENKKAIPQTMGYKSFYEMAKNNGGVMPDIYEISKEDYEENDYYDVY